ncbi:hypothetical protein DD583_31155, partial [Klebsiella pneumoniae]
MKKEENTWLNITAIVMMRMESLRRLSLWMRNRSTRSKLSIVKNRKKSL